MQNLKRVGVFVLLAALLWGVAVAQRALGGSYDDDGIYLQGAQSLAEGRSYRMLHLPGEPYQTKYPPLFSLTLSVLWRLLPRFPENLPLLLLPGALCAAAAAMVFSGILRRMVGLSAGVAGLLCAAWLLNTQVTRFLGMALTEMPFALCVALALRSAEGGRARDAALAGVFAGLGGLTRSIGVTLPAGLVVWFCARRRWRDAGLVVLGFALTMAPWWGWQAAAMRANGVLRADPSYAYDLAYSAWFLGPFELPRVVFQNLVQSAFFWASDLLPGSHTWMQTLLERGGAWLLVPWLLAALAAVLVLGGLLVLARRTQHPAVGFLPVYLTMVLVWPFEPARFYLPVVPLLLGAAVCMVRALGPRPWVPGAFAAGTAAAALLHFVPWFHQATLRWHEGPGTGMARMLELVREHTPAGSVIMITRGPMASLYLGRKTLRLWPYDDPLIHYTGSRPLSRFYFGIPYEDRKAAATRERALAVFRSARANGVTHAVAYPTMDILGEWVFAYWAAQLGLPVVYRDAELRLEVFELRGMVFESFLTGG